MSNDSISRRDFVGAVAATTGAAALATAPGLASGRPVAAADKVRLAIIGAGGRGNQLLDHYLKRKDCEFLYVIDVDDKHAAETADRIARSQDGKKPETGRDYRKALDDKNVDAVVIATPDHWHAIPTIHACQAGKDVYCEKPVAHNVAEGQAMLKAARKYNRVVAIGTQQRSSENFQQAVDAVRSGKLGKIFWVQTWNFENISPLGMGRYPDTAAPEHLDYDRWLGPAPKRPYNPNRCHLLFRWFSDYAGGMMSDWGVHLNDIVLWALDQKGPQAVSAAGGIFTTDDDRDTPDTLQVVYDFPGTTLTYSMRKGNGLPYNGHKYGILFCGTEGSLMLDRSGFEITPDTVELPYGIKLVHGDRPIRKIALEKASHKAVDEGTGTHIDNFFQCLKSRARPTTDIEIAHRSTNTTHLGNIAYKLGRKLQWDVETETFKNDRDANALLAREWRKGYELPEI
ncbi:MAG: putative dehydrogenase [Planctomycetota bacterium]|nr:putative dehydrogenase [Planctomycetota bacterium]